MTIDAGSTLEVGAWETIGSLAGAGTVLLNGSLVLADSGRSVFSGRFTGNGGFSKTGTGVFVYEGDSTGRSGFMMDLVEGGTFELNGRLGGGNVLLLGSTNRDATLAGVGSTTHRVAVNLFTLDDEVVISPGRGGGRGIGTLTADSFYLTHSGGLGRYLVTLDATGRSDLLYAAGGGSGTQTVIRSSFKVAVDPESTVRANHRYTIVRTIPETAIWAGERFDDHVITSSPYAFVDPVLSYKSDLTEVYLTFAGRGEGGRIVGLADAALTRNQRSVATAIERLPDGDPVLGIVGGARTYEDARRAFDALSGEVNASAISVASNDALEHGAAVLDRLRSTSVTTPQAAASLAAASQAYAADRPGRVGAPALPVAAPRPEYALWGQAFGSRGVLGGDFNAASLDRRTGGLVLGADAGFDRWRVGFAGAWSRSSFDVRSRLSSGEVDTYSGILYGSARFGALALRGGLGYAHHAVDTERTILFPGYSALVGTSREGSSGQAFAEAGYGLMLGSLALEPFAGLAHVSTDLDGFAEAGDAAALVSRGSRQDLTSTSLGLRVAMPIGNLTAKAGVSWRHAFGDDTPTGTFAFASNPGVPFTIAGAPIARDTLALETRLDWALSQSAKIALAYDGQFAQRAQEHRIKAELQVSF